MSAGSKLARVLTLRASTADKPKIPILLFVDAILGIQPYDWQCKILLNYEAGKQTAAACANFTGKTSTVFPIAALWTLYSVRTISKPSVTAQLIIIRLPCASSTKSWQMIDGSSVRQKRVGESGLLLRNCTTAFAAISQLGLSFLTLSTICSRCGRMCSMTNSGRPSFAGIWECKPNRRPKLERRPRSPVLKCSPIRASAGATAPPELSTLQPRGRRSAARTRKQ
jgi:hypothetical protein